ncbi:MAG: GTPase RsgA, partial [Pseudoruminococcus massiliensis]
EKLKEIYATTGFKLIECSKENNDGAEEVKSMLGGKISAFTGNSGVGKSTILNAILPELELETGDISRKLGRGRHTTRHTELYKICGGY